MRINWVSKLAIGDLPPTIGETASSIWHLDIPITVLVKTGMRLRSSGTSFVDFGIVCGKVRRLLIWMSPVSACGSVLTRFGDQWMILVSKYIYHLVERSHSP